MAKCVPAITDGGRSGPWYRAARSPKLNLHCHLLPNGRIAACDIMPVSRNSVKSQCGLVTHLYCVPPKPGRRCEPTELRAMSVVGVRRDKAALPMGASPTRQTLQPEA